MTMQKPTQEAAAAPQPVSGGATIADRFKLDMTAPVAKKASAGKGTLCAVIAGVVALGVSGVLTFVLYSHWQFLANA